MKLHSITTSIHGELPNIGFPCTIVRLSGCNLSCPWCDTKHDLMFETTPDSVAAAIEGIGLKHILITGGEPLLQHEEVNAFLELIDNQVVDPKVVIETNGTISIKDTGVFWPTYVVDYKLWDAPVPFHPDNIFYSDYIKFVFNTEDEFWKAVDLTTDLYAQGSQATFVFSPKMPVNLLNNASMAFYVDVLTTLARTHPVVMQVQLHKILEVE